MVSKVVINQKEWDVYTDIPEGWQIRGDGFQAPPHPTPRTHFYMLISNGLSKLNPLYAGGLLEVEKPAPLPSDDGWCTQLKWVEPVAISKTETTTQDPEAPKAMNEACRLKAAENLLRDLLIDAQVCTLEGWDFRGYVAYLKSLIEGIEEGISHDK